MKTIAPLILASASPRRQQLLQALGLEFEVVVRPFEEVFNPGVPIHYQAAELARGKSQAYDDLCQDHFIITSDTVVAVDGLVLGKPANAAEAKRMLQLLSGRSNRVITAICLRYQANTWIKSATTEVLFRDLEEWEIDHYIEAYKPFDKAGAYGIQEWIGMVGITQITGDYYNVVGLPTGLLWEMLREYAGLETQTD